MQQLSLPQRVAYIKISGSLEEKSPRIFLVIKILSKTNPRWRTSFVAFLEMHLHLLMV